MVNTGKTSSIFDWTDFISYIIPETLFSSIHYSHEILLFIKTSSLWPCRTVDKWLRLFSSATRFPEKPSGRPSEPPGLWRRAMVPLEDRQGSNDEPEEEVDPHCRLRGERTCVKNTNHWCFWCPTVNSKESVYLSFEQTAVEPISFKWNGPRFILCILTALTKRQTSI